MITIARYLPLKVPHQAFRGFAIPGKQAVASRPLTVNRKPTLQESLSTGFQLLCGQHPIPVLGAVNLRVFIRDIDHSFGRDAALIIRHAQRLTIRLLRLLDGHPYRHADVDMQLISCRILQVQQHPFPDAVAAVQLARLLQRLLHKLLIIHIHGSLKKESRRVSIALRSTVFQKTVVVSTTEGQLPLNSLSCLGELGIISPVHAANGLLATNLQHHLVQPWQRDGLVIS